MIKNIVLTLVGLLFIGCGSSVSLQVSDQAMETAGLKGAPNWVLLGDSEAEYSAVGTAPIIDKDVSSAISLATSKARTELAAQMKLQVQGYVQTKGNEGKVEEVTHKINDVTLSKTKPETVWITEDGSRVYVLVNINKTRK